MKGDKTDPGQTMALFDPNKQKQKTIGEVILMGYLMVLKSYYIFLDVIMILWLYLIRDAAFKAAC